jgi:hypothetical protein
MRPARRCFKGQESALDCLGLLSPDDTRSLISARTLEDTRTSLAEIIPLRIDVVRSQGPSVPCEASTESNRSMAVASVVAPVENEVDLDPIEVALQRALVVDRVSASTS